MAERLAVNEDVLGSSPSSGAKQRTQLQTVFFVWLRLFEDSNTKGVGKTVVFPREENNKNRGFL